MQYQSTRDSTLRLQASQVIAQGISEEGGLFVPEYLPDLRKEFPDLAQLSYSELAKHIFSHFLTDFSQEEIAACVDAAYSPEKFEGDEPVKVIPLTKNGENKYLLELWHGPTCAFKDMALQILPHFLTKSMKKALPDKQAVILTATSGDTGKAALEGFRDVSGTHILVFYPENGVSQMQKRQMETQEGENVKVCAIKGNFDDAQNTVKRIFTDPAMKAALADHNMVFSSANSINFGRLLPQIVYYFYAYFSLCRKGALHMGESFNVAVPTGNFGNILAAYYAFKMGLPVGKFICASNANRVLTDFIRTGVYDKRREFFTTTSPSMDILISSNLERLLYALSEEDSTLLSQWMRELSENGIYQITPEILQKMQGAFFGGCCEDRETARTIRQVWETEGYLCDPHTAVAVEVYRQYVQETGDSDTPTVIASTASPYKFPESVLSALGKAAPKDGFEAMEILEKRSGVKLPEQLKALREKTVRFRETIAPEQADSFIQGSIGMGGL